MFFYFLFSDFYKRSYVANNNDKEKIKIDNSVKNIMENDTKKLTNNYQIDKNKQA